MDTRFGRRARVSRLKPLASCLALALAAGTGLITPTHVAATTARHQPIPPRAASDIPLAIRFPPSDPRAAIVDRLLSRRIPDRPAGSIPVTNCNDSGAGSLRDAVDSAVSGDVFDMTAIGCSTITLTTGAIITAVDDISLLGPGRDLLTIDAGGNSQGLIHLGAGTLEIDGLTVLNGFKYASDANFAPGGCIYSQGAVFMSDAGAKYCTAEAGGSGNAVGGAIYALGNITLLNSTVSGSTAQSTSVSSVGGGVFTQGSLFAKYSIFRNNQAIVTNTGAYGYGGAAWIGGDATVLASLVQGGYAGHVAGLDLVGGIAVYELQVGNTTITDNYSYRSGYGSGLYLGNTATVSNSTITGNTEATPAEFKYGGGVTLGFGVTADLQSSIVSANIWHYSGTDYPSDIGTVGGSTITGANNMIGWYLPLTAPADTLVVFDPMLGPLDTNGGPTSTMLPLTGSPAINAGNNVNGGKYDQRGAGFPRVVGANADIGAVETDTIFANGFD
jgi:hypothetical protein